MSMHYHLIIHKEDVVFQAKDMNNSAQRRELAKKAVKTIDELIDKNLPNILQIKKNYDPRKIPDCIKPGDSVTLYGGRHGECLSASLLTLQLMDVNAEYHPNGYI